jgi:uncharacterized membrane protein YfcA
MPITSYAIFWITGFGAGLIDAIAGGGGLIALPVLLSSGLPPLIALGTNRLQSAAGEIIAMTHFLRSGKLKLKSVAWCILFVILGSSLGTIAVQTIHNNTLTKIIPFILLLLILYSLLSRRLFVQQEKPKLSPLWFAGIFGIAIGAYNGFFGPGTGAIWTSCFIFFLALDAQQAVMRTKPVNIAGNIVSVFWFMLQGHIMYSVALTMALGQIFGASIGARLVLTRGSRFIRIAFIVVVSLMTLNLGLKAFSL